MELWQVHGPNFTAGFEIENGRCTVAAPILKKYLLGRTALEIHNTVTVHRWFAFRLPVPVVSAHGRNSTSRLDGPPGSG